MSESPDFARDPREELSEAIAFGRPVDWRRIRELKDLTEKEIEAFQALEKLRAFTTPTEGSPLSPESSCRLEHFEIEGELGRGSHGVVHRARDLRLQRPVALKILRRDVQDIARRQQRYLREARALASVDHPGVVRIWAIEEDHEHLLLSLELIEGHTLGEWVQRDGPLPASRVLEVGSELCEALAVLHAGGLMHGDVKPDNVMCEDGTGRIVLLDFGIARTLDDLDRGPSFATGGTPMFEAPERFESRDGVGFAADVFSVGVLLHWLMTGRSPYTAHSLEELRRRMKAGQFEPLSTGPLALRLLVARCLDPDPGERPADAGQLGRELRRIARARRARRRIALGLVAMLATVAGIFVGPGGWRGRGASPAPSGATLPDGVIWRVTGDEGRVGDDPGRRIDPLPDVDGDGVPDLLVHAVTDARVISGRTGKERGRIVGPPGTTLLRAFPVGDVDGDGRLDFGRVSRQGTGTWTAVVVAGYGPRELYALPLASVADGAVLHSGPVGDVDGDGAPDYWLGEPFARVADLPDAGRLALFSGRDGRLLRAFEGAEAHAQLGTDLWTYPDRDGDGVEELLCKRQHSARFAAEGAGVLEFRDGRSGEVRWSLESGDEEGGLHVLGILADGDAQDPDLVIASRCLGEWRFDLVEMPERTRRTLWRYPRSPRGRGHDPRRAFGVPDLDGDGTAEITVVVTSPDVSGGERWVQILARDTGRTLGVHRLPGNGGGEVRVGILALDGGETLGLWTARGGQAGERRCVDLLRLDRHERTFDRHRWAPTPAGAEGRRAMLQDAEGRGRRAIFVPVQQPTIQAAIEGATNGDLVCVLPGVYRENLRIDGKDLDLLGLAGPDAVVVRGAAADAPTLTVSNARVRLHSLRLSGGCGALQTLGHTYGGGIFVRGASELWAEHCLLTHNGVAGREVHYGGALMATGQSDHPATVELRHCLIADNRASFSGGAVFADYFARIELVHCTVVDNRSGDDWGVQGGVAAANEGRVRVRESILWGNDGDQAAPYHHPSKRDREEAWSWIEVEGSIVQGGSPGAGNRADDPGFAAPERGDFRLVRPPGAGGAVPGAQPVVER